MEREDILKNVGVALVVGPSFTHIGYAGLLEAPNVVSAGLCALFTVASAGATGLAVYNTYRHYRDNFSPKNG